MTGCLLSAFASAYYDNKPPTKPLSLSKRYRPSGILALSPYPSTAMRSWPAELVLASLTPSDVRAQWVSSARFTLASPADPKACAMPSTIWAQIASTQGVRAIEDKELVQLLVDRQIPLGVCPTSNLTLGLYHRMEDHPIERLRRAGVPVSVNTDDPVLLQVDLPTEYSRCTAVFGWNSETCREIATTSMNASFASADTKARLLTRVAAWQSP
jgi:hypothetical protein